MTSKPDFDSAPGPQAARFLVDEDTAPLTPTDALRNDRDAKLAGPESGQ